jgi:c-di-GMP-related signal transduction protein
VFRRRSTPPPGTRLVHVGRQPLYDRNGKIVGYELLFRGQADAAQASAQDAYATSQVIVNAFTEFGLDQLVGGRLGFVNITREFLVGDLPLPFPPHMAVLEVLKSVPIDDEAVAGVAKLVEQGYHIALDDFVLNHSTERLLDLASYVKLNMLEVSPQVLTAVVTTCRHYPRLKLVAECVETEAQMALAKRLGFDMFQGYALARPQVVSTVSLNPSRLRTVRLLAMLNNPDVDMQDVADLVSTDPALSVRILMATNNAQMGLRNKVESVYHAAVMIGLDRLRNWITLMAVSDMSSHEDSTTSIMVRARFCQQLTERMGGNPDAAFTVGLLDGVCDLLGGSRADVLRQMPLASDLTEALLHGTGPFSYVLQQARAYENYDPATADPNVLSDDLTFAYLDSIRWAEHLMGSIPSE